MSTARDLLEKWPSFEAVSDDFKGAGIVVSAWQVSKWAQRGRIPAEHFVPLARFAEARGISGVTVDALAMMHAPDSFVPEGARI